MKGLKQTLQSKDLAHPPLQSFPELLGLPSLLSTKRQHFWAGHMDLCVVPGQLCSTRRGCLLHPHPGNWCPEFFIPSPSSAEQRLWLSHSAWLMEAPFSFLYPKGHSWGPTSPESSCFLGPLSQLARPPSFAAIARGLRELVSHGPQSVSSSQASTLFSVFSLAFSFAPFL